MKKLFSMALALVMALSLTVPAFADETPVPVAEDYTITITPPDSVPSEDNDAGDEVYKAYKIFDATYVGEVLAENGIISYTIDSATNPFFSTIQGKSEWFTLTQVNGSTIYVVEAKAAFTTEKAIELGDLLKAYVDANSVAPNASGVKVGDNFQLTVADKGYYFITSTLGSDIIVDTLSDITIQSKNDYPTLGKTADTTQIIIGENINYTLTITIPDSVDKNVVITDTLEAGLTFGEFTKVPDGVTTSTNGQVNTITIDPSCAGSTVEVKYTAHINTANGEIYDELNTNQAYLEYSEYKSATVEVDVATYEATFKKIDGATKAALEGVTFKLTDADGNDIVVVAKDGAYRVSDDKTVTSAVITTNANGIIEIEGLGNGTYKLVELSTLPGYNLLEGPVSFTIADANNYFCEGDDPDTDAVEVENNIIVNNSGFELPSTGGMGTTLFTVVGATLMLGAAVLLVTKKKMANEE